MKTYLNLAVVLATMLAGSGSAPAQVIINWTGSRLIPDNNATGVAFSYTLSDPATVITDVTVDLDLSGGWVGDLYAFLSHGSGLAVLLNRVGVGESTPGSSADGYGDGGLAVTLSSAGSANLHFYGNHNPVFNASLSSGTYNPNYNAGQLTGTWQPDGRGIAPDSAPSAFDSPGAADFSSFQNLNPNGQWTLFFSDLSPLNVSTLNSFSVRITAIPEPAVEVALAIFIGLFLALRLGWRLWDRQRLSLVERTGARLCRPRPAAE